MNFTEIAEARQSCRSYDPERAVEDEKVLKIHQLLIQISTNFAYFSPFTSGGAWSYQFLGLLRTFLGFPFNFLEYIK